MMLMITMMTREDSQCGRWKWKRKQKNQCCTLANLQKAGKGELLELAVVEKGKIDHFDLSLSRQL